MGVWAALKRWWTQDECCVTLNDDRKHEFEPEKVAEELLPSPPPPPDAPKRTYRKKPSVHKDAMKRAARKKSSK